MWKWEAEGQPKAVVAIVHNAYEHHSKYAWLIQKLRGSGFHVVTGDLPGHGEEVGRKVHDEAFEDYIAYVKKLLMIGIGDNLPLFVIGHGLGATLVMHLLRKEQLECAGIILSSPWLSLVHMPSKFSNVLSKLSSGMKINHEMDSELLTRNYEWRLEAGQDPDYSSVVTARWYKELQLFLKSVAQAQVSISDRPILLHSAGHDRVTDTAIAKKWLMNQQLSEFQYKNWKRLYHDIFQEPEREEVYKYTEAFMDNVLRSLGYIV
ncbi:alpha/beta hydrolase [Sporosarcina sp. HYO08]|uniref:alpha/beta hydrolase n=1 Tax=Sporosarcina sp. HYO08 TaxID=1759557 RepID=UPI0007944D9F|nr:alpha/beta hydrolase [Sporosarcina sp. HYO08]KXH86895.1 lysophospholipase [Sporosarcina sp. HYO08]